MMSYKHGIKILSILLLLVLSVGAMGQGVWHKVISVQHNIPNTELHDIIEVPQLNGDLVAVGRCEWNNVQRPYCAIFSWDGTLKNQWVFIDQFTQTPIYQHGIWNSVTYLPNDQMLVMVGNTVSTFQTRETMVCMTVSGQLVSARYFDTDPMSTSWQRTTNLTHSQSEQAVVPVPIADHQRSKEVYQLKNAR